MVENIADPRSFKLDLRVTSKNYLILGRDKTKEDLGWVTTQP